MEQESDAVICVANKMGVRCAIGLVALMIGLGSCAGPQPLKIAIDPQDETSYLRFANKTNLDGKKAFSNWMAEERGLSPSEVLQLDAEISSTRNPYDAYRNPQAVSRGAVIYKVHCARCHGDDARGQGPSALPDYPANDFKTAGNRFAATLHRGAPRRWFRVIRDGAGDVVQYPDETTTAMPPFSEKLAREQIWLVITYLQSLDMHAAQKASEGHQ
ncbi:MAG: c-type cytochrome [Phycisphaerales bacterium]|nr:c-type cytochrome [Phycisphaerales bacterium]